MRTSDTIGKLVEAIGDFAARVQDPSKGNSAEIKGKTKTGTPYTIRYSYASLPDFLPAVRVLLAEAGLIAIQSVGEGSIQTRIAHTSGEWLETDYPCASITNDSQKMGIAHTYARRYAILQTLTMAAQDDDDGAGNSGANAYKPPPKVEPKPTPKPDRPKFGSLANQKRFMAELAAAGTDYPTVKAFTEAEGWGKPSEWDPDRAARFVAKLKEPGSDVRARFDGFKNRGA